MFHHLLTVGLISLAFLLSPLSVLAVNFLQNADFESDSVFPWESSGGGTTATISGELIHGGSGAIKITTDKTSSYGFQQKVINLEGGMFYRILGMGATQDPNINSYFLRVAWYASGDGNGSQLSAPNDTQAANHADGLWEPFDQVVQAPISARSAKVRLVLTSKINGTLASAFFDDISFEESSAPTATPTLIPTPTDTPMPTATPRPTPTPTKFPTPTKTSAPTITILIRPTVMPTQEPSITLNLSKEASGVGEATTPAVLGITAKMATPSSKVLAESSKKFIPAAIALGMIGMGLSMISGILVWQKWQKMKATEGDK